MGVWRLKVGVSLTLRRRYRCDRRCGLSLVLRRRLRQRAVLVLSMCMCMSCVGGVGVLRLGFGQVRGGMGVRDVEFHEVVVMCVGVL